MTRAEPDLSEPIDPIVRAILDHVIISRDGPAFIERYAEWVMTLRELPDKQTSRVFIQLATVAKQFFAVDCKNVARSLAALARIGLR